jgi:uncharacterized protein YkwD
VNDSPGLGKMLCLVSRARAARGLPALQESPRLDRAARLRARAIKRCRQFSHTACGQPFGLAAAQAGYRGSIGENLAWGNGSLGSPGSIFATWLGSLPHRHNLFRPEWRQAGLARVRARRLFGVPNVTVWVLELGRSA